MPPCSRFPINLRSRANVPQNLGSTCWCHHILPFSLSVGHIHGDIGLLLHNLQHQYSKSRASKQILLSLVQSQEVTGSHPCSLCS